jgi:hypothetical protein
MKNSYGNVSENKKTLTSYVLIGFKINCSLARFSLCQCTPLLGFLMPPSLRVEILLNDFGIDMACPSRTVSRASATVILNLDDDIIKCTSNGSGILLRAKA